MSLYDSCGGGEKKAVAILGKITKRAMRAPLLACAGLACVLVAVPHADAAKKAVPSFFNSTEVQSTNMKPFKKWTGAVARYSKETASAKKGSCKAKHMNSCHYDSWTKFLKSVVKKSKVDQVKAVNAFMNRAKYITDPVNWGKKDYWESPIEFMAKFGDCEDYAITKYMSLKRLGFKDAQMRIVAVKDLNLKVGHAVLVVYLDGKIWLLDNQIKQMVEAKSVRHYQPVFSINEKFWWRHRV